MLYQGLNEFSAFALFDFIFFFGCTSPVRVLFRINQFLKPTGPAVTHPALIMALKSIFQIAGGSNIIRFILQAFEDV
jgi:uncharacterized protein (DUF362 family)